MTHSLKTRLALVVLLVGACASPLFSAAAQALETRAKQAIVVDEQTGAVLFEKEADAAMHPSSMSKLMTLYMLMKQMKEGRIKPEDTFNVSEKAWRMQGSKMFVDLGSRVSVEELLRGIIIQSGNDACIVVAEGISGTEEAFAREMNDVAKELGLAHSHFVNSTGWPDENHLMTARDLATLAHHLIRDFPEYYHYFSELEYTHHGIKQANRNLLLHRGIGVDGLKTGHTEQAGYGIVVSALRGDRRVVVVVNGLESDKDRADEAELLVNAAFRDFENKTLAAKGEVLEQAEVWLGEQDSVALVSDRDLTVSVPRVGQNKMQMKVVYQGPIPAPIEQGAHVADLLVTLPGGGEQSYPLYAAQGVEKRGPLGRIVPALKHYLLRQ